MALLPKLILKQIFKKNQKMKKSKFYVFAILLVLATQVSAQTVNDKLLGKWLTKDNAVVEFFISGTTLSFKQISAKKEKDKKDNGKILGKNIANSSGKEFKGIVINPDNNKEYSSVFIVSDDGKKLLLKVKWGFINFNEDWVKVQ